MFFCDSSTRLENVRKKLNIETDCVLTFAPTFRGVCDGVAELNFPVLLDQLEAKTGKTWCALIRQHYKVKVSENWNRDRRIINASSYPEMQDILFASDIVISDYSSLVGDYVLLNRPVFLYVPDLEEYKSGRGLYFDIEKSPFWYARSEAELFEKILNVDAESARKNCRDILDFYGHVCEKGNASEQVCQWILGRS
jgi:CDP-glycerol glycerophosphotransferase